MTEVPGKAAEFWILTHALHLVIENIGLQEVARGGEVKEFIIGHACPKEIGEAGGQFVAIELTDFFFFGCRLYEV